MNNVFEYEAYKFDQGSVTKVTDPLTVESPLQININGEPFTVVMQTPGDEIDLTYGLLYAENAFQNMSMLKVFTKINSNGVIDIVNVQTKQSNLAKGYLSSRSLLSMSSCGICGKKELSDIKPNENSISDELRISFKTLFKLQNVMRTKQTNFKRTGGCHGVAAFDFKGNLLAIKEDIGRHNALDKVVGQLIQQNDLAKAKIITFSGRISYEIVSKAFRAKIPIITAISSPSSLAIDFAKEFGLTLVGFTRVHKATVYSNLDRIDFE